MHPYKWDGRVWHWNGRRPATRDSRRESALRSVKQLRATLTKRGMDLDSLTNEQLADLGNALRAAGTKLVRLAATQEETTNG